jgi:putative transposase
MPNTYTQLYLHYVFAVQSRENVISAKWEESLYKYISGIITNKGQKLMVINGMPNHIHILVGIRPSITIADLARDIKSNAAKYVNDNRLVAGKFSWQEGYGAFSVSPSQVSKVATYIENQKEHHKAMTFKDEYLALLKHSEVDYKEEYLFEF